MTDYAAAEAVSKPSDKEGPDTTDSRKNLVLLTIDSLRADCCGFMGCEWDTTPTLDKLAADSVVYENAFAPGPRTPSSMSVAFTGRFNKPSEFSWGDWGHRHGRISSHLSRHRTLPERLQAEGYTTVGITANPWTHYTDFDTGFDHFVEITGDEIITKGWWNAPFLSIADTVMKRTGALGSGQWNLTKDWLVQWSHYYETILNAVSKASEPYFLWVFLLDPHQPYLAPRQHRQETSFPEMYYSNFREMNGNQSDGNVSGILQRSLKRAYRDAIRSTDDFVNNLLEDIDGDPAIIVHSDHGEAFGEHENWGHPSELYEENLHVPLLVYNGTQTGRVSTPISLRTLPELASEVATKERYDPEAFTREYVLATTEGIEKRALRGSRWKLITDGETDYVYDFHRDKHESINRSEDYPELTASLRRLLDWKWQHAAEQVSIAEAVGDLRSKETTVVGREG